MRAVYAVPSHGFRQNGAMLQQHIAVGAASCIHQAAESGAFMTGEEIVEVGPGRSQRLAIEALPLPFPLRRKGAVLVFFYLHAPKA